MNETRNSVDQVGRVFDKFSKQYTSRYFCAAEFLARHVQYGALQSRAVLCDEKALWIDPSTRRQFLHAVEHVEANDV